MQELKLIVVFCIGMAIINAIYLYVFFKKDYKTFLIIQFEDLAEKLGFEIIKEDKNYLSKVTENKVILGSDINLQIDISKLTELYFKIFFIKNNNDTGINKFLRIYSTFLFRLSIVLSIIFCIGVFLPVIVYDFEGLATTSILFSSIMGLISLIILSLLYMPFKKLNINLKNDFGEEKVKLIQRLYWYIPISVLNSSLRIVDYTRWLFINN